MTRADRDAIVIRDGSACRACRRASRGQVHHILPRALGGSDTPANLVTLCGRCHMLVSPVPVATLLAYFRCDEGELLRLKACVEVAIHTWVLSAEAPSAPSVPEWKRQRPRAGRVWDSAEDAILLAEFDAGLPMAEIAARLGRGLFAVEVRLAKLRTHRCPAPR